MLFFCHRALRHSRLPVVFASCGTLCGRIGRKPLHKRATIAAHELCIVWPAAWCLLMGAKTAAMAAGIRVGVLAGSLADLQGFVAGDHKMFSIIFAISYTSHSIQRIRASRGIRIVRPTKIFGKLF